MDQLEKEPHCLEDTNHILLRTRNLEEGNKTILTGMENMKQTKRKKKEKEKETTKAKNRE